MGLQDPERAVGVGDRLAAEHDADPLRHGLEHGRPRVVLDVLARQGHHPDLGVTWAAHSLAAWFRGRLVERASRQPDGGVDHCRESTAAARKPFAPRLSQIGPTWIAKIVR